jgi:hypothetical protein
MTLSFLKCEAWQMRQGLAADDARVSGSTLAPQIFLPNDPDHGITAIDHLGAV